MFWKIFFGSLFTLLSSYRDLLKSVSAPAAIYFVLEMGRQSIFNFSWSIGELVGGVSYIVLECMLLLSITLLGINATRVVLLNESSEAYGMRLTKREVRYFFYTFLCMLPLYIIELLGFVLDEAPLEVRFFSSLLFMILTVAWLWAFTRFLLVFPSIAVDGDMRVRDSWRLTRKYQWVFLFSVLCMGGVFFVMSNFWLFFPFGYVVGHVLNIALMLVFVLMLAIYYTEITVRTSRSAIDGVGVVE